MIDNVTLRNYQLHISVFILKLGENYGNQIFMGKLTKIRIYLINMHVKFFMTISFSSHRDVPFVTT